MKAGRRGVLGIAGTEGLCRRQFLAQIMALGAVGMLSACAGPPPRLAVTPPPPPPQQAFYFEPLEGIPQSIKSSLEDHLIGAARRRGVVIARGVQPYDYRVRGRLAVAGSATGATVLFAWDVHDRSGRPVFHIEGQEIAPGSMGDPWTRVDASALENIAKRTVDALAGWLPRATAGGTIYMVSDAL